MTLGYGNYTMQEISTAPGYAFVVPNQPNFSVNGVPIPAAGGTALKSNVPVPAYVPQKDNTGNYIMAGAAATAAIMLGILALKKGKKPNLPKNTPAPKPTPKKIDINTPEIQAARKAKAPEIAQRTAEEAAQKQVQRTLAVDYARQADREAVYAAHIGTNEPAKIRPELAILKDSMLTRAARNTKKKQGIFQRAKNAVVNLYENTRGKIRRAKAQRRLNKAAQGTRGKDIIQVEPTQEQLKQMAFNRSVERGSKVIDSHVATEAETRAAKSEAHRIIAQASNTPYGTTITDKGSISLVRPELRELKQSMIEHAKRQAETPIRVAEENAKKLVNNVQRLNYIEQIKADEIARAQRAEQADLLQTRYNLIFRNAPIVHTFKEKCQRALGLAQIGVTNTIDRIKLAVTGALQRFN